MEWVEIRAASLETAKEQALEHLGVDERDAEFEVLSEPKMGLFGRVKQEAHVRARVLPTPVRPKETRSRGHGNRRARNSRQSEAPRPRSAAREDDSRRRSSSGADRHGVDRYKEKDAKNMTDDHRTDDHRADNYREELSLAEQADLAESFVQGIAGTLGINLQFKRRDLENGIMRIEADGDGVGIMVGRRGATAQAIDELVRTVLQRSGGTIREGKIRIDLGGIRAKRAAALAAFTKKMADEAVETDSEIALEPMNRMDRKTVHDTIADLDDVESRSEGDDPYRRVVISPSPGLSGP